MTRVFSATEDALCEHLLAQRAIRQPPHPPVSVPLNRRENAAVEIAVVAHGSVTARRTLAVAYAEVERRAPTPTHFTCFTCFTCRCWASGVERMRLMRLFSGGRGASVGREASVGLGGTEVVRPRTPPQEAKHRIQVTEPVLQRRAGEAPAVRALERSCRIRRRR